MGKYKLSYTMPQNHHKTRLYKYPASIAFMEQLQSAK